MTLRTAVEIKYMTQRTAVNTRNITLKTAVDTTCITVSTTAVTKHITYTCSNKTTDAEHSCWNKITITSQIIIMIISNESNLTFKLKAQAYLYISMTDNPIQAHNKDHYTAISKHDTTFLTCLHSQKKKKKF